MLIRNTVSASSYQGHIIKMMQKYRCITGTCGVLTDYFHNIWSGFCMDFIKSNGNRSPVDFPEKGLFCGVLVGFFYGNLNKLLNKQLRVN